MPQLVASVSCSISPHSLSFAVCLSLGWFILSPSFSGTGSLLLWDGIIPWIHLGSSGWISGMVVNRGFPTTVYRRTSTSTSSYNETRVPGVLDPGQLRTFLGLLLLAAAGCCCAESLFTSVIKNTTMADVVSVTASLRAVEARISALANLATTSSTKSRSPVQIQAHLYAGWRTFFPARARYRALE